ncbi:DUF6164 family protein [Kaarinaea lacus]
MNKFLYYNALAIIFAMTKRIFSYPATAEQEADSIRHLLQTHHVEYFETPASRWGFSNAAIWLKNDEDTDKVERLLQQHHEEFAAQARQQYQLETGYDPNAELHVKILFTLKHILKRKSALVLAVVGFFLLYLYLSLFFSLFN